MIRTAMKQVERKCMVDACNNAATQGPRCQTCHTAMKTARARVYRAANKERELLENEKLIPTGWRRCAKCKRKRQLSEFSTSLPHGLGYINYVFVICIGLLYFY